MSPLRLALCGASGRMGREIRALAARDRRLRMAAAIVRGSRADLERTFRAADVVIDFTEPAASLRFAEAAARAKTPIVIGTTGFAPAERARLKALSKKTAVFLSPNFSLGMSVLFRLAEQAAASLGGYKASIVETHHIHKKDKPSGTAIRLAEAVKAERGGSVPIKSVRKGEVVGQHVLRLAGPFETIELSHEARSRRTFAAGALEAARWVAGKRPGLYDMSSLLR